MEKTNTFLNLLVGRARLAIWLVLILLLSSAGQASAQTINQGFNSDEPLQRGLLVVTKQGDPNRVEKATKSNLDRLRGVVVQPNDSPVTLAGEGQNVFVADNGEYKVLVSNENGPIKKGDYISVSSLAGIGMKATDEQKIVLGQAAGNFNGTEDSIGSYEDPATKKKVNFGRMPVSISISRNPWLREPNDNSIPKLLEKASVSIAGKPVNTQRVWLATAVFLGTVIVVGVMIYSAARSSLIAVGRNPLSKTTIVRGLIQVVILSVVVFIVGMFAVYLLLKL